MWEGAADAARWQQRATQQQAEIDRLSATVQSLTVQVREVNERLLEQQQNEQTLLLEHERYLSSVLCGGFVRVKGAVFDGFVASCTGCMFRSLCSVSIPPSACESVSG